MEWTSYHDINDIYGYLDYLVNTYPDVCSVQSIGNSIEGQPLKVSNLIYFDTDKKLMFKILIFLYILKGSKD